jgi:chemosensory pili system protein ChpC
MAEAMQQSVRSLLIPLQDSNILVPNSLVAEVSTYHDPDALMPMAPDWLLGRWEWRELYIPLVSFDAAIGDATGIISPRSRVVVMKALSADLKFQYYAVISRDMPKIVPVYHYAFEENPVTEQIHELILCRFLVNGEPAFIPHIDRTERAINQHWVVADSVAVQD